MKHERHIRKMIRIIGLKRRRRENQIPTYALVKYPQGKENERRWRGTSQKEGKGTSQRRTISHHKFDEVFHQVQIEGHGRIEQASVALGVDAVQLFLRRGKLAHEGEVPTQARRVEQVLQKGNYIAKKMENCERNEVEVMLGKDSKEQESTTSKRRSA
jgi:hypothetical protein